MASASWTGARSRGQPTVRALTVRQPWAWAIIYGGKDVENRRRRSEAARGLGLGDQAREHQTEQSQVPTEWVSHMARASRS
jgi:hypothetical protein